MASPVLTLQLQPDHAAQVNRRTEALLSVLHAHAIFVLDGSSPLLTVDQLPSIQQLLAPICADMKADLLQIQAIDDQLHLLLEYLPTIAIADLLESLQTALIGWNWNPKVFVASYPRPDLTRQMRRYLSRVCSPALQELQ
jgi:hypothetical protein